MIQPWFRDAKFGIFIHWGIYAVGGREASWAFYNFGTKKYDPKEHCSYQEYMQQAEKFAAENYDPKKWAQMFKAAGAKYAVLTTKHHDGVALWDTKANNLSVIKKTPAGRDLVTPFVEALREENIKVGLYFSHPDWSNPDFPTVFHGGKPHDVKDEGARTYTYPFGRAQDESAWQRFIKFHRAQVLELVTQFRPDLLWFDGGYERTAEQWEFEKLNNEIRTLLPHIVINDRFAIFGDYETPEQGMPLWRPDSEAGGQVGGWEFCMTMNHQWGYSHDHSQYKSTPQLTRTLAECAGMGGNLLLNVGPRADGVIPQESEIRLAEIGAWIHRNHEGIYGTLPGLPAGYAGTASTLSPDRKRIFIFVFDRPWSDLPIKGVRNKIISVRVAGTDAALAFKTIGGAPWANVPGITWVDTRSVQWEPHGTMLIVDLENELDLYQRSWFFSGRLAPAFAPPARPGKNHVHDLRIFFTIPYNKNSPHALNLNVNDIRGNFSAWIWIVGCTSD
jgi:alpha-L-fucosidase